MSWAKRERRDRKKERKGETRENGVEETKRRRGEREREQKRETEELRGEKV